MAALLTAAACRATPAPDTTAAASADPTPVTVRPADDIPADAATAIRATIDAVNATAGGPVADQQAALIAHVDPARRAEAQSCPAATTTVRLEPVDQGLRSLPEQPAGPPSGTDTVPPTGTGTGTPTGTNATTYALPTLIRIFAGDRLIGTDLTTLRLIVTNTGTGTGTATGTGTEAYLTPFCVN